MSELLERFKRSFDAMKEPAFLFDRGLRCLFANQSLYKFLGVDADRQAFKSVRDFWPRPELRSTHEEYSSEFKYGKQLFPVKLSITPLDGDASLVRVVSGVQRSQALHSLHAQRLETLGMLSGGMAHDFNNILTGILGHITYLKTILPGQGRHWQSLAAIEEGARKASLLTHEILNFSKIDQSERPQSIELGDLIQRTCNLLRGAISPEYELSFSIPDSPTRVLSVEGKLAQVLINLVMNARDAISSGGYIRVELDRCEETATLQRVFKGSDLSSRVYARLAVSDNGSGISADVLTRVFEPYFSTKKDKGTGLGLAIVDMIVRQYAGAIDIHSRVGEGTTISIYLPIVEEQHGAQPGVGEQPEPTRGGARRLQGGSERILIVDDEYPVRNVLCLSLEHLGYSVEIAGSGAEALEKYLTPGSFDLVILDMLMPNISGDQLFFRLRAIDPELRVLVISGYSSEQAVSRILENGGLGFVQKPFTIDELARRVRECLDHDL